jgi:hypothetical protein
MSNSNDSNNMNNSDNEDTLYSGLKDLGMQVIYYVFIIFLFLLAVGLIRNSFYENNETFVNSGNYVNFNQTHNPIEHYTALSGDIDLDKNKNTYTKQIIPEDKILTTNINTKNDDPITVKIDKNHVPIDYWIFEKIGKNNSIKHPFTVYMTDLQDSTFSNQNMRHLIYEILDSGECGYCDTPNSTRFQRRVFINWIFNHSRFTSNRNKRYRMYNLYKKYFPLPLEADDYEAPLLDSASKYPITYPSKNDIVAENHLDVPETSKVMCTDQLFVEHDRDFSVYCNGEYLKWNAGKQYDSSNPLVARYYLVIVTDPDPVYSYTSDGLIMVTENNKSKSKVELLSNIIKEDPLISWRGIRNRIDKKLSKLGELMVLEHRQESMIDGIQKLLNRTKINLYQTFAVDFIVRSGEPYIMKITASPTFREYGSKIAEDLLESVVNRTKLMLNI